MEIFEFGDFFKYKLANYIPLKMPQGVRRKGDKIPIINCVSAFDIETSHEPLEYKLINHRPGTLIAQKNGLQEKKLVAPESWMYHWQWAFDEDFIITGRTWSQFRTLVDYIHQIMTKHSAKLIVFVHNLSYEFQYLRGILDFTETDVFAVKSRRVLKATYGDIEFRCSALLTNLSLDEFTKKYKCPHAKLTGDIDHNITRYPFTKLTPKERDYCLYDVWGLVEAIKSQNALYGDTLYTMPLTSTGYVRREAKEAMRRCRHGMIDEIKPTAEVYIYLREAFRGGNTHANRYFVQNYSNNWEFLSDDDNDFEDKILHDVISYDRSSSYPDVIVTCDFPVSQFIEIEDPDISIINRLVTNQSKALLFDIEFNNFRLRNTRNPCPYIPLSKCKDITDDFVIDNGRILTCSNCRMVVTDIDYRIIANQYTWDNNPIVHRAFESNYGKLPPSYVDLVVKYYCDKTRLKNVEGEELTYDKFKNLINALYGMMAQDPGKPHFIYRPQTKDIFIEEDREIYDIFNEANDKAFLPYQWGVWVTAWARYRLQEGIDLAGADFVYADTDSVKTVRELDFTNFNSARIKSAIEQGAYAQDTKGETHYIGVFECEGKYTSFATMGAKKYVYIPATGKHAGTLQVTIAGVNKSKGGEELEKAGGIKAFKKGFEFIEAGGTDLVYVDVPSSRFKKVSMTNGMPYFIEMTPSVTIVPSTYKLGLSEDFENLLEQIAHPHDTDTLVW